MRIYLDNDVISGIGKNNLSPIEFEATAKLIRLWEAGKVTLVTSEENLKEIERYKDDKRPQIKAIYDGLARAEFVNDHVESESISKMLFEIGLHPLGAQHVMMAIIAKCDSFVTCDERTISKWIQVQLRFPSIKLTKPAQVILRFSDDESRASEYELVLRTFGGYTAFVSALFIALLTILKDYPHARLAAALLAASLPSLVAYLILDRTIRVRQGRRHSAARGLAVLLGIFPSFFAIIVVVWGISRIASVWFFLVSAYWYLRHDRIVYLNRTEPSDTM